MTARPASNLLWSRAMAGVLWITDREPGIRQLFAELLPEADALTPDELDDRLALGQRPDAIVIDGTQLLELPSEHRRELMTRARVLVCTGLLLASMPTNLVSGPGVAVLAKPFCVEDLEAAAEWIRGGLAPPSSPETAMPFGALVQRRRPRSHRGGRLPAR